MPKLSYIAMLCCIGLVRLYQLILSPLKPHASCCFVPSCSEYAICAIRMHGAWKGSLLAIKRIVRCYGKSEYSLDDVPEVRKQ